MISEVGCALLDFSSVIHFFLSNNCTSEIEPPKSEIMMLHIEQITPELTWRLRHEVLYPDTPIYQMWMDEDDEGIHFGAFTDNKLVGIVSLFQKGTDFQFRKFAISPEVQGMGYGKTLLSYVTDFALAGGATRLWCNARLTAAGFYARFGFMAEGSPFHKNGFDYVMMEKPFS